MTPELQILSWDVEPEPRRWRGFAVGDRVRAISVDVDARTWFDARNDRPLVIPRGTTGTVVSIDTGAGVEVDWDGSITAREAYGDDPGIVGWGNDPEDLELMSSNIILSWDTAPTTYPFSGELWQPETVRTWPQRFVVGDILMGPSGENYYTILQFEPDIVIHSSISDADFVADPSVGRWSKRRQASVLAPVQAWDTTPESPQVQDLVRFVQDYDVLDEINLSTIDVFDIALWKVVAVNPEDDEWPGYREAEGHQGLPKWGLGNIKVEHAGMTWSVPLSHWQRYLEFVTRGNPAQSSLQVRAWDTGHKIPWAEWKDWDSEGLTPERGYLTLLVGDVLTYANGDEPERPVYEVIATYPPRVRFLIVDDKSPDTKGKVLVYEPEHEPEWYMEPIIEASILSRAWTVEPEPRIWEPGSWERSMEEISGVLKVGDVLSEHLSSHDWQVIAIEPYIKIQLILNPRERYVYDMSTDNWHQAQESSLEVRAWDTRGEDQFYVGDRVRMRDCSQGSRAWNARTHTFTVPAGGLGTVKEFPSKWGPEYVGVDWDGFPQAQAVFTDRTDIVGWSTRIENVELVGTYD